MDSIACAIVSKPDDDFNLIGLFKINFGSRKCSLGINNLFSKEYFLLSIYITAFDVTSAPEPAVVGIAISLLFL